MSPGIANALGDPAFHGSLILFCLPFPGSYPHHGESSQRGPIGEAVRQKAEPLSHQGDHHPRQGGSHKAGRVEKGGVQCDGVTHILGTIHHLHHEGLPGGDLEGVDDPQKNAQKKHMPVDHRPRKGEEGQQQRLHHAQHLAEHDSFSEIPLLQKGSRKKTEKEHRNLPCEVHQPQMQGGVR